MPVLVNRIYRHYKGGLYKIIAIGKHTDDTSEQVVYRAMDGGQVWIRRLEEWNTPVNGKPRFTLVEA